MDQNIHSISISMDEILKQPLNFILLSDLYIFIFKSQRIKFLSVTRYLLLIYVNIQINI